jgi:transposase
MIAAEMAGTLAPAAPGGNLRRAANGIRQDIEAGRYAITLPWNNGQMEGQITASIYSNARCMGAPSSISYALA